MSIEIKRLTVDELPAFREFCLINWGEPHPLIHDEKTFEYYYCREDGINFLVAKDTETGEILSAGGYIYASDSENPDVFNSFLLSKKKGPLALSLSLLEEIKKITDCRTMSCNNIRPKVAAIYNFLGSETPWLNQYYRFNTDMTDLKLSKNSEGNALAAGGTNEWNRIEDLDDLCRFDFNRYKEQKPFKDYGYVKWRYFENPWLDYKCVSFGEESIYALLLYRIIEWDGSRIVRLVDYIGDRSRIDSIGLAVDSIIKETGAEFADMYAFGISPEKMAAAGFKMRTKETTDIVPNYLEPPLMENIDFMIQTSDASDFCMFKADGDQDRKRIIL